MGNDEETRIGGEYGSLRANLDIKKLDAYLAKELTGFRSPMEVKQFKTGQSNPTYFLTDAQNKRYVMRKKPPGQLLSSTAHQVEREYRILHALHTYNQKKTTLPEKRVPVPEPYLLCEDVSVVGTPFYVMEYLDGRIFTDVRLPEVSPEVRRECWLAAIRALASLSSVPPSELGLPNFAPTTPYFPRQIKSLSKVSEAQAAVTDIDTKVAVGKIPSYDELVAWYSKNLPDESKIGLRIVHGDYKMDNVVFHKTENRVIGILDWELTTFGSPLADLANLTMPWAVHIDDSELATDHISAFGGSKDAPIDLASLEREYCQRIGQPYPIREMTFVRSWMLFRLAIISQGIAARAARRQASSANAATYASLFLRLGHLAKKALIRDGAKLDKAQAKL